MPEIGNFGKRYGYSSVSLVRHFESLDHRAGLVRRDPGKEVGVMEESREDAIKASGVSTRFFTLPPDLQASSICAALVLAIGLTVQVFLPPHNEWGLILAGIGIVQLIGVLVLSMLPIRTEEDDDGAICDQSRDR